MISSTENFKLDCLGIAISFRVKNKLLIAVESDTKKVPHFAEKAINY